jgi:hypothetical protein
MIDFRDVILFHKPPGYYYQAMIINHRDTELTETRNFSNYQHLKKDSIRHPSK